MLAMVLLLVAAALFIATAIILERQLHAHRKLFIEDLRAIDARHEKQIASLVHAAREPDRVSDRVQIVIGSRESSGKHEIVVTTECDPPPRKYDPETTTVDAPKLSSSAKIKVIT